MIRPGWCFALLSLALAPLACGAPDETAPLSPNPPPPKPPSTPPPDPSSALFRSDHVLEVTITVAPEDWEVLRNEPRSRSIPHDTCAHPTTERRYTYFPATITIDGETIENVGVRKKGNLGSLSTERPSLKVKLDELVPGQKIAGLDNLTFNNSRQDASYVRQCLGYEVFRSTGSASPRCSFAHVTVNDADLGIYVHVESIKKEFLRRNFDDDSGNLYEGQGSDFRSPWVGSFQPKTNEDVRDCSDVDALSAALQADDANLLTAVDQHLDIDRFLSYWATEVIVGHWDGYAQNTNNYFIYHDPSSDRFQFIPWGVDAVFEQPGRSNRPRSLYVCGILPWKLYHLPESRTRFVERMRDILTSTWDADAYLSEIDRIDALIRPYVPEEEHEGMGQAQEQVRDFIRTRAGLLLDETAAGPVEWDGPLENPPCLIEVGHVSTTFTTTWGTLGRNPFETGRGTLSGTVDDAPLDVTAVGATAGQNPEGQGILQVAAMLRDGTALILMFVIPDLTHVAPGQLPLDLATVLAVAVRYDPRTNQSENLGLLIGGRLRLEAAGTTPGAPVTGAVEVDILSFW